MGAQWGTVPPALFGSHKGYKCGWAFQRGGDCTHSRTAVRMVCTEIPPGNHVGGRKSLPLGTLGQLVPLALDLPGLSDTGSCFLFSQPPVGEFKVPGS